MADSAVGFARVLPKTQVCAYALDADARKLCRELARLNGIGDNLTVEGRCDIASLNQLPLAGSLVFCDCEGDEIELLRPEAVPALRSSTLVVELHDCLGPGITAELCARFQASHEIRLLDMQPRIVADYSIPKLLTPRLQTLALLERPLDLEAPQQWGHFIPEGEDCGRSQPRSRPRLAGR